ncbi:MAG: hypothetical protein AAB895_00945, partial [Patescibacteria group bacterium]
ECLPFYKQDSIHVYVKAGITSISLEFNHPGQKFQLANTNLIFPDTVFMGHVVGLSNSGFVMKAGNEIKTYQGGLFSPLSVGEAVFLAVTKEKVFYVKKLS